MPDLKEQADVKEGYYYNFDYAVPLVMKEFGNNPMNKFFLASYLSGFPDEAYKLARPDNQLERLIYDKHEHRFWRAVFNYYCLDRKKYTEVCSYVWDAILKAKARGKAMQLNSQLIQKGLHQSVKFFEPTHGNDIIAAMQQRVKGMQGDTAMTTLVGSWLRGEFGSISQNTGVEQGVTKQILAQNINKLESMSEPVTLLKALSTTLGQIGLTQTTQEFPFGLCLFFRESGYEYYLDQIESLRSDDLGFGASFVNSTLGVALRDVWLKAESMPGYQGTVDTIQRYESLLFYLNVDNELKRYLKQFLEDHKLHPSPSRVFPIPEHVPTTDMRRVTTDTVAQINLIIDEVKGWSNFKAITSTGTLKHYLYKKMPSSNLKFGKPAASKGGSGVGSG
jgi:hypothetical protein